MKLSFSPRFNTDLAEIADYIAADNPVRAQSFALEIRERCRSILKAPEGGRSRADIEGHLRSVVHGRYVIFYTLTPHEVRIQRVLHSARNIKAIFDGDA